MAALSADRNTPARAPHFREPPVKGATKIFAGSMVAIDATNVARPAYAAAGLRVIGRAEHQVDNSSGLDGDKLVRTGVGVYRFANSASTDLIALKDIGASCYAADDQTVAKTDGGGTRSIAGTVFDVDAQGVWVRFS